MKRGPPCPRLFNEVLEAIASLREAKGSTKKNIVEQVELILSRRIKRLRHDTSQVHKAIRHGISSGLIKAKNGKYALGLNQRDYGVFRKLQKLNSRGDLMRQVRGRPRGKRGRRKGRRRRGRGKRRSDVSESGDNDEDYVEYNDEEDDDEDSRSGDSVDTPGESGSLEDRGRRRGRKRKGRRRKRRGRRRSNDGVVDIDSNDQDKHNGSTKSFDEEQTKFQKNFNLQKDDDKPDPVKDFENTDVPMDGEDKKCDNPECLCSLPKGHQ